ncbi:MAG: glycosyltransferase family 39 protein [Myxococcales bacterium]|nr:glycosyltransferase family 39 protein [Myxococcales bacterium]MCB9520544.1 glycosyltransferase family 39 protein [Myxococcales bacterium]
MKLDRNDAVRLAVLAAVALALWAPGLGGGSIVNGDDGFYGVVIRALARGEDPISALGWRLPVFYSIGAVFVRVLGPTELALHLPSMLFGVTTVLLTYVVARRLAPERERDVALWGALLLIGTTQLFMFARRVRGLDLCFETWMLGAAALAVGAGPRLGRWAGVGALIGLAFLTKSVVVAVFAPSFALLLWEAGTPRQRVRATATTAAAAAGVAALWFLPIMLSGRTGGIADHFGRHVVDRATSATPLVGEVEPATYYIDTLFDFEGAFAALSLAALAVVALRVVRGGRLERFVLGLVVTTLCLFSAASSKVSHYILPAYPGLALAIAIAIAAATARVAQLPRALVHGGVAALAAALLALGPLSPLDGWGSADYAPSSKAGALAARAHFGEVPGKLYVFNEYHAAALFYFDGPTALMTTDPAFAAAYDRTAGFVRGRTHELATPAEVVARMSDAEHPACLMVSADRTVPGLHDALAPVTDAEPFEGGWLYCTRPAPR